VQEHACACTAGVVPPTPRQAGTHHVEVQVCRAPAAWVPPLVRQGVVPCAPAARQLQADVHNDVGGLDVARQLAAGGGWGTQARGVGGG
jgi:hypothetical protein